jgi:hypothetical protein
LGELEFLWGLPFLGGTDPPVTNSLLIYMDVVIKYGFIILSALKG